MRGHELASGRRREARMSLATDGLLTDVAGRGPDAVLEGSGVLKQGGASPPRSADRVRSGGGERAAAGAVNALKAVALD